ncbi:uncharacterized protein LOC106639403 [Copidosoma floridanum]|uniref:uncharacterized protein LOC106639403 n=1 Tax=Copidosoma floridanum TaxID=29053 RepID=UPI0006C93D25|nr:uncharacterized protein LOC106639403 [Copidosoma floridanum]
MKIPLFVLSCLFANVKMQKFGEFNFTSEWMIYTRDTYYSPMIAKVQESLIFVTFPLNFSIKLESSRLLGKPCEVPVPQIKKHRNKVVPVFAEGMGNDNVLVAVLEAKSKKEANFTNVWLYVIDPQKCTYDFTNIILDAPLIIAKNIINIVLYKDCFDFFLKSNVYCVPETICNFRYGNDLTLLNDYQKLMLPYEDENWNLMTKKDFDASDGYLYMIMNTKLNSSVLRYYDSKLSQTRELRLNYDDSLVYWYDDDAGSASTCFRFSDQELECMLLDGSMGIEVAVNLYYDSFLQYYSIIRLGSGEALVVTILSNDPVGTYPVTYVQLINRLGEVSSPIKFQEYVCENVFEINTFKIREGLFCVSTTCSAVVNNKCIGPADQLGF